MLKKMGWSLMILLGAQFLGADIIQKIQVEGNKKVSRETIQFYMKSREGGIYDPDKLKEDFKALWETGFFENIRIEDENGANGKIVRFIVVENPLISSVVYKTGKKVKESDINEKLQSNNIILQAFSYYSPAKTRRVKKIITDMLLEKGYNQAVVTVDEKNDNGQVALTIRVDPGSKTRIADVVFPGIGKKSVSAGFLRRGMKNNRSHGILSHVTGKDVFNNEKINEDLEEVRLRLQQKGYLEAKVGTPEFSMVNKKTVFGKLQKMLKISIPVELGPCYRVGNITLEGNKVIRGDFLKSMITLKKGQVYNIKKRNKFIEEIQKFYGGIGYFYAQVVPGENLDPVKQTADLTISVQENEIVYLGKLEFTGNTFTKDHVIRREWFLREGRRLNINALEDSIKRMKQLGLVTVEKMPEIKADPQDPQKINITADVKELNRQMINFNVGYSGYEGWFIALGYSTQNFLGMGETFTLNLQSGTRAKNYQFAFTEPYLFNLPANFGIDVFKTSYDYPTCIPRRARDSTSRPRPVSGNTGAHRWFIPCRTFPSATSTRIMISSIPILPIIIPRAREGFPLSRPPCTIPRWIRPSSPRRAASFWPATAIPAAFLGGDVYLHKMKVELVKFQPVWKRHVLGFHAVYEGMEPFGGKAIPFYEKFFLGGERSIRGFDIYNIGPRDKNGNVLGGNKSL